MARGLILRRAIMRSLLGIVLLASVVGVAGSAEARTLRLQGGSTVRVVLSGKAERGVGLRAIDGMRWRLQLPDAGDGEEAVLVDVTEGATAAKWVLAVEGGALVLDGTRFVPGHAYRVELKRGGGSALVYLYPPRPTKGRDRVVFDEDRPAPALSDDDGIAFTPKPAL
jgi:hypothetical protein